MKMTSLFWNLKKMNHQAVMKTMYQKRMLLNFSRDIVIDLINQRNWSAWA